MADRITYSFSEEKNAFLKKERGISFDEIIFLIENIGVLATVQNKGRKYSHQKMFIINVNGYAYVVPFVYSKNEAFLKTVYPSRYYTKIFFGY
ncbi:MAG: toxin [Rickettsiales bacterium]